MSAKFGPIGVLTVSDRVFQGEYEDLGGPAVCHWLQPRLLDPIEFEQVTVPDELDQVCESLNDMATRCALVVTTGGTGIGPRDITPEAMTLCCDRMLPGFGEKMRAASWEAVPTAILSRAAAGLINSCLVINLPGNPKAVDECLEAIWPAIPHAVEIAGGSIGKIKGAAESPHPHGESSSS